MKFDEIFTIIMSNCSRKIAKLLQFSSRFFTDFDQITQEVLFLDILQILPGNLNFRITKIQKKWSCDPHTERLVLWSVAFREGCARRLRSTSPRRTFSKGGTVTINRPAPLHSLLSSDTTQSSARSPLPELRSSSHLPHRFDYQRSLHRSKSELELNRISHSSLVRLATLKPRSCSRNWLKPWAVHKESRHCSWRL